MSEKFDTRDGAGADRAASARAIQESRRALMRLVDHLAKRGYVLVAVVGVKPSEQSGERVKLGITSDLVNNDSVRDVIVRLLRDTADMLESGPEGKNTEIPEQQN